MARLVIWVAALLPGSFAATDALAESRLDIGLIFKAARSVVRIEADRPGSGIQIGTGVVLADGEIATACHVVRGATTVIAVYAGRRRTTSNMRVMLTRDVCAFSVAGLEAPAARVRPDESLQIGEPVTALGFSGGAGVKWKTGAIVRKNRFGGSVVVQTTSPFTSGASGGPLLDTEGNVVGLLSFRTTGPDPKFFAVPVEWGVDAVELNADQEGADRRFSTLPFWDRESDELPFFMQASSLEAQQRWEELRLLCEVWQAEEPTSGEPAFIKSRIEDHFGRFEAMHDQLVEAVGRDGRHVHAWASLVRIRVNLKDISGAHNAYSQLRTLNAFMANQLSDEGLIAGQ
jgi:hypothetical protein